MPPLELISTLLAAALFVLPLTLGIRLLLAGEEGLRGWRDALHPLLPMRLRTFRRLRLATALCLLLISLAMGWKLLSPFFTDA